MIFRPSFVFGPDGGILPTFAKLAKLAPVTPIIGNGRQRIQPIWADDVAKLFAEATTRVDVTGRTFEVGGPDIVSWNEFWERLKRARGQRRPEHPRSGRPDEGQCAPDRAPAGRDPAHPWIS